ncbi:MAG TPA: sel1 repeat family protein [Gammaproteobacteria bacterium]|nr:sel1 repeat family protein [Gammaproteobacteria bacterium]
MIAVALLLLLGITTQLQAVENMDHRSSPVVAPTDDATDLARLEVLANLGDTTAQYQLGHRYLSGNGVDKNARRAAHWFGKAARAGDVSSQRILATLFYSGTGVPKAPAHALKWFRKAAEGGDVLAQTALADMYYRGTGMRRPDLKQAWRWMMIAARNGDPVAQYRVGLMLRDGRGTRRDLSRAFIWLHVAALNTGQLPLREKIEAERDALGERMSERQLALARERGEQLAEKYGKGSEHAPNA